jgi:2-polyprenyl-6-methoxyphenol hydroxylase-like FAD-dependent oxidoreductase
MFLALLLARQGVEVALLEAHHDFDRDFRGDTVHPATLDVLDRIGLAHDLHRLPHTKMYEMSMTAGGRRFVVANFRRMPWKFNYVMLMSQALLLDFLAQQARQYPNLKILLGAQASDLVRENGLVAGVVYHQDGRTQQMKATLTVAADGRFSKLRKLAGLEPVRTSPPMDVVWLRLPRRDGDAHDFSIFLGGGRMAVLLDRETDWQIGYVIPKGGYQRLREAGIESLQLELAGVVPFLADRVHLLTDWRQVTLLSVESSRLKRWHVPGMLLIGDAAHVMTPVAGVGINYAVQDAVAASKLLAAPLRAGRVEERHLARVQARREWPTAFIQTFQRLLQSQIVSAALDTGNPFRVPLPLRLLTQTPLLNQLPARLIGYGVRPELPRWSRDGER